MASQARSRGLKGRGGGTRGARDAERSPQLKCIDPRARGKKAHASPSAGPAVGAAAAAALLTQLGCGTAARAEAPVPIQELQQIEETTEMRAEEELNAIKEHTEQTAEFSRLEALLDDLEREKLEKEEEARQEAFNSNQLCRTPFGIDVVGLTETVALIGALVGGLSARRRRREVEEVNAKLRSINSSLRQQARGGALYAPSLNYAPSHTYSPPFSSRTSAPTDTADASASSVVTAAPPANASPGSTQPTADEDDDNGTSTSLQTRELRQSEMSEQAAALESQELIDTRSVLKKARRLLKDGSPSSALVQFNKALVQTRQLGSKLLERRAVRGLAACKRDLGDYSEAIDLLKQVLKISEEMQDFTGNADAYGTIADLLADLGRLEEAGHWYDRYLAELV